MRPTLLLTFLFLSSFAFAQDRHELKTDLVTPFFRIAHLSYELIPAESWGIEGNLWYNWAEDGSYYVPPIVIFNDAEGTYIPVKQQVLTATVATKFYFFRPAPASGAFAGAYLREDVLLSPWNHNYAYLFLIGYGGAGQNFQYHRQLRFATGLQLGYKYVIGRHFLAEASLGLDINPFEKYPFEDWYGIL
ncbi:MAG: hypothetical protein ABIQ93_02300, partial [Saprospiraceae bacterium]